MRKGVLAAAGLAILAAVSWYPAPAQAMAISAPAALKSASDTARRPRNDLVYSVAMINS